jgi:type II secretion system protein N
MSFPAWPGKTRKPIAIWQRTSVFFLAGVGLLLIGMLAGLYLFFPAQALKQRIIHEVEVQTGAELRISQLTLYPMLTLDAERIKFALPGMPQSLDIDSLSLTPQWSTLMSGDPGVHIQGQIMNGTISAGFQKSGAITAALNGLQFDLPIREPVPFTVAGALSQGSFAGETRLDSDTVTHIHLQFANVTIRGLDLLKADGNSLALGEISLEIEGKGRSMRLKTLSAKGGVIEASGDGTLLIGRTAATSRIKIALMVRPGANADPSLRSLLQLAGNPDDEGRYTLLLTGSLAQPILNPGG